MRHFSRSQFHATESAAVNMSSKNSQMPAEDLTQPLARASRQMRLLTACGAVIVAVIIGATATLAINMRASALMDTERELGNVNLILAEQIAQSFQAVELVETSVVEHMRSLRVESDDDFERLLSGPSTYQMLADKISGLSQIEAITLINGHGRLINSSRYWPIPQIDVTDRDYFRTLRDDPEQIVFLSEPLQSRVTGAWTVFLARKFVSSDGKFLGLVLGALRLQYFEGYFHALSLGQDASISLFRRDGMLLARHPHQDPKIGQIYPLAIPTVDKADSAVIRRVSVLDGIERMIVTRHIRDFPAIVGVSATVSAAVADAERDALRLSGAGGAIGVSRSGCWSFSSHGVRSPIISGLNTRSSSSRRSWRNSSRGSNSSRRSSMRRSTICRKGSSCSSLMGGSPCVMTAMGRFMDCRAMPQRRGANSWI